MNGYEMVLHEPARCQNCGHYIFDHLPVTAYPATSPVDCQTSCFVCGALRERIAAATMITNVVRA
jgi:hypothetical protein